MKNILLFGAFALVCSGFAHGNSVTITNSGFAFSPDNITINSSDTVNFQLGGSHNAMEVNEATWNANGNTPLPGFLTPFGGGQVTGLTAGVHFYVCEPHASLGMKGKITVNGPAGLNDFAEGSAKINIYPNPTNGKFTIQFNGAGIQAAGFLSNNLQSGIEIYNVLGEKMFDLQGYNSKDLTEIDISSVPDGIYFIRINDNKKIYTEQIIKQ